MTNLKQRIFHSRLFHRLSTNFQLSLIILFCLPAAVAIGGFGVFRFLDGDLVMGIVDTLLVLLLLSIVTYSLYTDRTWGAGIVLVLFNGLGVVAVMYLEGLVGFFWGYAAIIAAFFLSPVFVAVIETLFFILASIVLADRIGVDAVELASYVVTTIVIAIFSFAFAMRSKIQHRQLEEMATVDPLTGAWNRRVLEDEMNIAIAEHERTRRPYAILMLDLDFFKEVNDIYGHAEGDKVLRRLVQLINDHTRRADRLFRFGGEEFVVLLPDTEHSGLETAARHIHQVIRDYLRGPGGFITCSLGGALLQSGDTWESWLQRADHALYGAKGAGRDTMIIVPEGSSSPQNL